MTLIKVIIGTTRDGRFGDKPAAWIMDLSKQYTDATFELIDLKDINLPLFDEPVPPLMGDYRHEHTKAWAKTIGEADGFIFVTGEYNFSVPPSLKNALDYLAAEWRYKPVVFVSYGAAAGGLRAVQHLRDIAGNLGYIPLQDAVIFTNYWNQLDESGNLKPSEEQLTNAHKLLKNIIFWAERLKPIREELAAVKNEA